ncbi:MAG: hypothetical protein HYT94_04475 [Parcubacteria group bacterium]|nr:hypothetical protein [Parcubacteria group bacterium]
MSDIPQSVDLLWQGFDPVTALFIFVAYCILDALIAKYTIEVASLDEYRAATTGVISHFLLALRFVCNRYSNACLRN